MKIAFIDDSPSFALMEVIRDSFREWDEEVQFFMASNYEEGENLKNKILNGELEVDLTLCDQQLDREDEGIVGTDLAEELKQSNHLVITMSNDASEAHVNAGHYFFDKADYLNLINFILSNELREKTEELKSNRNIEVKFN